MFAFLNEVNLGGGLVAILNEVNFGGGLVAVLNEVTCNLLPELFSDFLASGAGSAPDQGAGAELLAVSSKTFQG